VKGVSLSECAGVLEAISNTECVTDKKTLGKTMRSLVLCKMLFPVVRGDSLKQTADRATPLDLASSGTLNSQSSLASAPVLVPHTTSPSVPGVGCASRS